MVKGIGDVEGRFRELELGGPAAPKPDDKAGKLGSRKINITQASKAVGGNLIANFFNRIKLFFGVGERKEFFRDKSINDRIDNLKTNNPEELYLISRLFDFCFPNDELKDKKILKLMNKFIRPQVYELSSRDFFGTEDAKTYVIPKDPKATHNLIRLAQVGITLTDIKDKDNTLIKDDKVLDFLADDEKVKGIMEEFGLTTKFKEDVIKFSADPQNVLAYFGKQPDEVKKNIEALANLDITDWDLMQFIQPGAKDFDYTLLNEALANDKLIDTLSKLQELQSFAPADLELQRKLDEHFKSHPEDREKLQDLVNEGVTADEFATYINYNEKNVEQRHQNVLDNIGDQVSIDDCIGYHQQTEIATKLTESFVQKLKPENQTEENQDKIYKFFTTDPLMSSEHYAKFEDNPQAIAERLLGVLAKAPDGFNYNDLVDLLETPEAKKGISDNHPVVALMANSEKIIALLPKQE